MTPRLLAVIGVAIGLAVSGCILTLMAFGVSGVLVVGKTDLMYVFWPSSMVLPVAWRTSAVGVSITIFCVETNCLLYAGLVVLIGWVVRRVASLAKP